MNIINFFKEIFYHNEQPLVDPMCPHNSPLPLEVQGIIFQNLKTELPNLALVCKNWKAIVDDKPFRETIRPAKAFGSSEWKKYIGVDAGEETLLPRRAYGDMEKGNYYLTFIPGKVKKTEVNGKGDDASMDVEGVKEIALDSLEVIGQLVSNPIKGNKVGYTETSWQEAIVGKRTIEKPHWVLISKELIGRKKTFKDQKKLAKAKNINIPGTKISGLIDTTISVFMEYVRSGERNFIWDPAKEKYNSVRVNEQTRRFRLCLGFAPSGLLVAHDSEGAFVSVGFALARKSS